jgi:hypothetical protein
MSKSTDVTTGRSLVVQREDPLPRELSEASAAKRARWFIWFTVLTVFGVSWCVFMALVYWTIAGIQQVYRSLWAH